MEEIAQWLLTQGVLGAVVAGLLWERVNMYRERKDMIEAHKTEVAAERSLNAKLQEQRLEDQKVLIPLSHSMVTAVDMARQQK